MAVPTPSGGSFWLAVINLHGDGANPIVAPAGWTLVAAPGTAGAASNCGLWVRVPGTAEPATYTWTNGGAAAFDVGQILAFNNVHGALAGAANNTNGSVIPAVSLIIGTGINALILELMGTTASAATLSVNNNSPTTLANTFGAFGGISAFSFSVIGPQNATTTPDVFTAGANWSGGSLVLV